MMGFKKTEGRWNGNCPLTRGSILILLNSFFYILDFSHSCVKSDNNIHKSLDISHKSLDIIIYK